MTKKKIITVFVAIGVVVVIIAAVLCAIFLPPPSPRKIYRENLHSIVELKSSSESIGESFGTAEFIDGEGRLVTNAHVVTYTRLNVTYTFDEYAIRFADEEEYRAVQLIKYDVGLDVAVLQLTDETCEFQAIKMGDSTSLHSGDTVYAIGNAVNYGLSMSQGIVGIPLLRIEYSGSVRDVIQCDLTIAEGNSGGALLDERGRLVGITTFRTKDNYGNVVYGIAYCIPIRIVTEFVYGN